MATLNSFRNYICCYAEQLSVLLIL